MLNKRPSETHAVNDAGLLGGGLMGLAVTFHNNAVMEQDGRPLDAEGLHSVVDCAIRRTIEDGADPVALFAERDGIVSFLAEVQKLFNN